MFSEPLFEPANVLKKPRAGQPQEIETEFRILDVKLLDLAIAHAEHRAALDALQRLGALVVRRQHAELTNYCASRKINAGLHQTVAAADDVEHRLRLFVLIEQHF